MLFFNAFFGADLKRTLCNSGSVEKLYPLEKEDNLILSWSSASRAVLLPRPPPAPATAPAARAGPLPLPGPRLLAFLAQRGHSRPKNGATAAPKMELTPLP